MRLHQLDGLRGLFCLLVVFFHFEPFALPPFLYSNFLIRESWIFVNFFFVLSGFVIAYNYNHFSSRKELWSYMKKRFIRLYPLLFYTVILYFAVDVASNYLFPGFVENVDSFSSLLQRLFDSLLFMNSTPILGSTGGMNGPSWSISAEMIAYLFYGAAVLIFTFSKRNAFLFLTIVLGSAFLIWRKMKGLDGDYRFVSGLQYFSTGYFSWYLSQKIKFIPAYFEYLFTLAILLMLYHVHGMASVTKNTLINLTFPVLFGGFILVMSKSNGWLTHLMNGKVFQLLGRLSYSIYLNHALVLLIVPTLVFKVVKMPNFWYWQLAISLSCVAFVIIYSELTYRFVEKKGGNLLRKLLLK